MARSSRALHTVLGLLAAAVLAPAASARAAPAPVPCQQAAGDHHDCTFYPAGDGQTGGAPVVDATGARVGYLHKGVNWVICQRPGRQETSGAFFNHSWAWTLADNNVWGWVSAVYASGGDNDGPFGGVPDCGDAHGQPPGGAPAPGAPPAPAPPPPPPAGDARTIAVERAITFAESKVGTRECTGEQPAWERVFGFDCHVAWCGVFAYTALDYGGFALTRGRMSYTENIYTDALTGANGLSIVPKEQAQRGDMILYNFAGSARRVSHVGLVTAPPAGGALRTVEGNTGYNPYPVVADRNPSLGDSHLVAIVRVSNIKGQPPAFRQYAASNGRRRQRLNRRYGLHHGARPVEVGPGEKIPASLRKRRHRR
jgi:hypothetical protein